MKQNHSAELLAPAGSADSAWAAFNFGADAVYAGLPRYSARAEAANFSSEQMDELIGFAHAHGKKVYLTLNTLVQQAELSDALETLALMNDLHADGVIVQDMGVARMVNRFFPNLDLHGSTQLAVHNADGANLLSDMGFSRVVLARELSLQEIGLITKNCGIETEVFIHGALCYSYSGLCLFSSHLQSRSGNRGRCAYCCRQKYDQENGDVALPFAMKDFAVGEYFDALLETGVASLKIEGRMKGPAYVGAVTDFYRRRIHEQLNIDDQQKLLSDIQTIFGRASTDLYLKSNETNPIDPTTNGHRGALIGTIQTIRPDQDEHWLHIHTNRALRKFDGLKIEMPGADEPYGFSATEIRFQNDPKKHLKFEVPADSEIAVKLPERHPYLESGLPVYCSISQEVRQRYTFKAPRPGTYRQRKPVDISIVLNANGILAKAKAAEVSATVHVEDVLSEARQPEKTQAAIRKAFEKTGETEWSLQSLNVEDNGRFAPASILNETRRTLLEKLSTELNQFKQAEHFERLQKLIQPLAESGSEEHWSLKLRDLSLLDELSEEELSRIDEIIVDEASSLVTGERHILHNEAGSLVYKQVPIRESIPVIQRNCNSNVATHAAPIEVSNVGALKACQSISDLTADWPLYTLNSEAAVQWQELGIRKMVLSPEDTGDNLKTLLETLGDRAIIPLYQHTPLMISATKPEAGEQLFDRQKKNMRIEKYGDQYVLFFEEPFSLLEHLEELRSAGARNFRIDFSYGIQDATEAKNILSTILSNDLILESYDGNFDRSI